jgi:hypothetical protein
MGLVRHAYFQLEVLGSPIIRFLLCIARDCATVGHRNRQLRTLFISERSAALAVVRRLISFTLSCLCFASTSARLMASCTFSSFSFRNASNLRASSSSICDRAACQFPCKMLRNSKGCVVSSQYTAGTGGRGVW